ncbi:MAG: nicotinamide mononucleotide transporter [Clostridia bacterium]|nr:nicotinamide mononucleotide transporter [Clostridia bacterium]
MGSKAWDIIWLACGWGTLITVSILSFDPKAGVGMPGSADDHYTETMNWVWFIVTLIGAILAPLIVNLMANQKVRLGSGIGVVGAGLDVANYWNMGIIGSVMTAVWAFITYVKGFISSGKQKGEFKAAKTSKKDLIVCGTVALIGCAVAVILYFAPASMFAGTFMEDNVINIQNDPMWIKICNIILIVSMMISQYLLTAGNASAWFAWIITNILQIITAGYVAFGSAETGNPAYFIVGLMFIINTVKGCVMWYEPSDKKANA